MSLRRFFAGLGQIFFAKPREIEESDQSAVEDPEDWLPEWEDEAGDSFWDDDFVYYIPRILHAFKIGADEFIFFPYHPDEDAPDILGQSLARRLQGQFQSFQYRLREQFPYRRHIYHNYQPINI